MRTIPVDTSVGLLFTAGGARPQIRNHVTGELATDRDTGAPLMTVDLVFNTGGRPELIQVSIPRPGIPEELEAGMPVKVTGLIYMTGEKNGRRWEIFRADAVTWIE